MSFFIKNKRKNGFKTKEQPQKKPKDDEEVTSESEDDVYSDAESEDETETAQEKRVKLAKIYLEEIKRLENKDEDEISEKLKQDYLIETGRFRSLVADLYENYDNVNLKLLRNKCHKLSVTCLCVSSDNCYVFSGSKDGGLIKWNLKERNKIGNVLFPKKTISCLAVSECFKFLAIAVNTNEIFIYCPDKLEQKHVFRGHRGPVTGLVFRKSDPVHLYSCSRDKSVKCWSMDELSYLETLFGHQDAVTSIDALLKERAVTSGGGDSSLRIWKIPEESQLIFNGMGNMDCVKLINEDNFIAGSDTGELSVWSSLKKKPLCSVKNAHGSDNWITSIAAFVNTDLVASGSNDGFIRLWKLVNSCRGIEPLFSVPVQGFVNALTFSPDGTLLIAGVGQEHRCGRWSTIKSAKNGVVVIPLIKHVKK